MSKKIEELEVGDSDELVEAAGLTILRERAVSWLRTRLFKGAKPDENTKLAELLNMPVLLRIGFLLTGTKTTKVTKDTEVDVVLKAFELSKSTKDGKPVNVITLNQRIGLDKSRNPLNHVERTERCFGAVCTALLELLIPREPNKAGNLTKTREFNEAAVELGFPYWNHPLEHAKLASKRISSDVVFPIDAFEIPKPPKKDEARTTFKVEFLTKDGKALRSVVVPKALYDTYRDKTDELVIRFVSVNPDIERMANKANKALTKAQAAEADEAAKIAKQIERIEDAETFE